MQVRTAWIRSAVAVAAGILAIGMTAPRAENFTEFAPVISSTPIIQRVTQPREECWTETITTDEVRRLGGISLGSFDTSTNVVVPVRRDVQLHVGGRRRQLGVVHRDREVDVALHAACLL